MIERLANWWRNQKEWRRTHLDAFARVGIPEPDGVTPFQRQLMAAVGELIPSSSFQSKIKGDETYFVADVPNTKMRLFVYSNEAGLGIPTNQDAFSDWRTFEEWDYRTPDELIAAVVEKVKNAV
jgi:hypothetical protein